MALLSIGNTFYSTVYAAGPAPKNPEPNDAAATPPDSGSALDNIIDIVGDAAPVLSAAGRIVGKLLHITA